MAEGLARLLWERSGGDPRIKISSAGLAPVEEEASPYARELLSREGLSMDEHIPRRLTASLVREARLILAMEEHHRRLIGERYPAAAGKLFLLKEFAGIGGDAPGIKDPFGGSREIYRRTLEEIREAVEKVIDKLAGKETLNFGEEESDQ